MSFDFYLCTKPDFGCYEPEFWSRMVYVTSDEKPYGYSVLQKLGIETGGYIRLENLKSLKVKRRI